MKKSKKLKIACSVISSFFLLAFCLSPVLAQVSAGPDSVAELINRIEDIAGYIQIIILTIGIIMIMWAGLIYITAGGDETKLGEARKRLIWGLVGIGVAVFAYVAERFVISILG